MNPPGKSPLAHKASQREVANDAAHIPSGTVSFADVAHQTIIFDSSEESSRLILALIDTPWMQRLRRIRQTGYTSLVYMFAEHSRFGHSIGVAYLANRLMKSLMRHSPGAIKPYQNAVAAAALLHDIGHVAPGSHLAERVWAHDQAVEHEALSTRIIREDPAIVGILEQTQTGLTELVCRILEDDQTLPPWCRAIISGGGWNADRGNWTIVDSAMASVSYGRYNVFALLDAYRLSTSGHLVLQESRLDALTHFFVARDSMYRQVYQHRVLQGVDALCERIVLRLRDRLRTLHGETTCDSAQTAEKLLSDAGIFCDETMAWALTAKNYANLIPLEHIFQMTEAWWGYHTQRWLQATDPILADLASRLTHRRLFKTIRLESSTTQPLKNAGATDRQLREAAETTARELGFDPRYYVFPVQKADKHRGKEEDVPPVLLDNGEIVPVTSVEPLIAKLLERPAAARAWLAVPKEVKEKLGRVR